MSNHVGFTGTKAGMTKEQWQGVSLLISQLVPTDVHHGDCVGADEEFHKLTERWTTIVRHAHPPVDKKYWANVELRTGDVLYPEKSYHDRNHDIVHACKTLIVAPISHIERLRSGTWSTFRYARKIPNGPRIIIVRPDGTHHHQI